MHHPGKWHGLAVSRHTGPSCGVLTMFSRPSSPYTVIEYTNVPLLVLQSIECKTAKTKVHAYLTCVSTLFGKMGGGQKTGGVCMRDVTRMAL